MIDLEGLVQKTIALESKYYELLSTHQQLVHAYEGLSEENAKLKKQAVEASWRLNPDRMGQ